VVYYIFRFRWHSIQLLRTKDDARQGSVFQGHRDGRAYYVDDGTEGTEEVGAKCQEFQRGQVERRCG